MDELPAHQEHYTDKRIKHAQLIWGTGFFSPGGPEEVARIVEDVDITGKAVLDVGCGMGGPSLELLKTHGAKTVLGIDIEQTVLKWAQQAAETAGLRDSISFKLVQPGPFPLEDSSFDVVFSKETLIEIADKEAVYAEILRVLKPGGWFVASDWLKGDGPESDALRQLVAGGPLEFNLISLKEAAKELKVAGFIEVAVRNRNAWYLEEARRELAKIEGPMRLRLVELSGQEPTDRQTAFQRLKIAALDSGDFCPAHIKAMKPLIPGRN
jgi:ubiquinone/menaquinone biosynthesis C-methylase UbiE